MKPLLFALFLVAPALSQIEATAPATGILIAPLILYRGQLLAAGLPRAEAVRILGPVKTIVKPRQTSSSQLVADLETAATILYRLNEATIMRSIRLGQPRPEIDDRATQLGPAIVALIAPRCGLCWLEMLELPLEKGEALRVILLGPARDQLQVAAILLDKSKGQYADLAKPWSGRREAYLGPTAYRITQEPGVFKVEKLDPATGVKENAQ